VSASLTAQLGESLGAFRGIFANANIRRVQLAFAGAITGTYAYAIAVSVFAYERGGVAAVGVLTAVRLATAAAISPFAASFADRFRRERVMLASDLLRVVTVGIAAIAADRHWSAYVVYAMAVLTSIGGVVFRPAASALLPTIAATPEEMTAANVSYSTLDSIGSFVGPALGALLLAASSPALVFAFTAATFAWSAVLVARITAARPEATGEDASEHEAGHEGMLGGVRAIRAEPRLALLIGLSGAQAFVAGALGVLVVVTALRLLDLGSAGVGILEAVSGIGSIVGAAVMLALLARKRLGEDLALGIFLWGAPLVVLGLFVNTAVALLAWGLIGLGNTLVDVAAITLLQRTAPPAVAARVFGVLESMVIGGMALGSLVAPILVGVGGARFALIVIGAVLPILVVLSFARLRAIDEGARVDEERIAILRDVPFLAPLPLATLEFLAGRIARIQLAAGGTLFRRGDHGDRFYVLTHGSIEIELDGGTKRETAPAYVGEIALLHDVPRTATVAADTACELWALERDDFLAAVTGHAGSTRLAQDVAAARIGTVPGPA
jgi:MFS family permease